MTGLVEVLVGVVGRAHGIRGDAFIDVRIDELGRRFQPGFESRLVSGGKLAPEHIRWYRGRLVVFFRGYPDRTAVETLYGERLFVDVPADETLNEPEEYFDRQFIGPRALDAEGRRIGGVTEVLYLPAQGCFAVETSSGRHLIPFVPVLVTRVDLMAGEVQFTDVGGLPEESG